MRRDCTHELSSEEAALLASTMDDGAWDCVGGNDRIVSESYIIGNSTNKWKRGISYIKTQGGVNPPVSHAI